MGESEGLGHGVYGDQPLRTRSFLHVNRPYRGGIHCHRNARTFPLGRDRYRVAAIPVEYIPAQNIQFYHGSSSHRGALPGCFSVAGQSLNADAICNENEKTVRPSGRRPGEAHRGSFARFPYPLHSRARSSARGVLAGSGRGHASRDDAQDDNSPDRARGSAW